MSIVNDPPVVSIAVTALIPLVPSIHSVFIQLLNRSLWYVLRPRPSWLPCEARLSLFSSKTKKYGCINEFLVISNAVVVGCASMASRIWSMLSKLKACACGGLV